MFRNRKFMYLATALALFSFILTGLPYGKFNWTTLKSVFGQDGCYYYYGCGGTDVPGETPSPTSTRRPRPTKTSTPVNTPNPGDSTFTPTPTRRSRTQTPTPTPTLIYTNTPTPTDLPLVVPNVGMIEITDLQAQPAFGSPNGEVARDSSGAEIWLPQDSDNSFSDSYIVTNAVVIEGEGWLQLFMGNESFVWVPLANVSPLTALPIE